MLFCIYIANIHNNKIKIKKKIDARKKISNSGGIPGITYIRWSP